MTDFFDLTMRGLTIGPIELRWYSVMILTGLLAGIVLAQREAKRLGEDPEHVVNIAVLGAVAGLIGARTYHVVDRWNEVYVHDPVTVFYIWNGGIGIFGAIAGSAVALAAYVWWVNRSARAGKPGARPMNVLRWFDIGAPAFLLGQGIGRWGNFFNEELFGPPTDLPWGIPIAQYPGLNFHPLFLYESLLSLLGVVVILYVARRLAHRLRVGDMLLMYFIWYPAERFALEFLRIDNDFLSTDIWKVGDVPMAQIVSTLLVAASVLALIWWRRPSSADLHGGAGEYASPRESRSAARRRRRRLEGEAAPEPPSAG